MKRFCKKVLLVLGYILTAPLILVTWIEHKVVGEEPSYIYTSCKELLALCPTPIGEYMRLAFYRTVCTDIASDVCFIFGSMLAHRDITIGSGSVIGAYTILGYARIGKNVLFGAHVSLLSGKYQHGKPESRKDIKNGLGEFVTINIGDNCWIGQDAIIMAHIGNNCTVAAGSVVYKDVPDGTTVMGNPARKVNIQ